MKKNISEWVQEYCTKTNCLGCDYGLPNYSECQYYNDKITYMNNNKHTHGGARAGAGRPKGTKHPNKEQSELSKSHTISMTDREWEIFQKNGGTKNLRRLINLGKFRKII